MQRVPLIVNTRSRSREKAFIRALDLRKAELVRDRLEGQDQLMGSYPEGHDMRARLEAINLRRPCRGGGGHPVPDRRHTAPVGHLSVSGGVGWDRRMPGTLAGTWPAASP
jgi:hypothetical protein